MEWLTQNFDPPALTSKWQKVFISRWSRHNKVTICYDIDSFHTHLVANCDVNVSICKLYMLGEKKESQLQSYGASLIQRKTIFYI